MSSRFWAEGCLHGSVTTWSCSECMGLYSPPGPYADATASGTDPDDFNEGPTPLVPRDEETPHEEISEDLERADVELDHAQDVAEGVGDRKGAEDIKELREHLDQVRRRHAGRGEQDEKDAEA